MPSIGKLETAVINKCEGKFYGWRANEPSEALGEAKMTFSGETNVHAAWSVKK